jgi:hypothetical protein
MQLCSRVINIVCTEYVEYARRDYWMYHVSLESFHRSGRIIRVHKADQMVFVPRRITTKGRTTIADGGENSRRHINNNERLGPMPGPNSPFELTAA